MSENGTLVLKVSKTLIFLVVFDMYKQWRAPWTVGSNEAKHRFSGFSRLAPNTSEKLAHPLEWQKRTMVKQKLLSAMRNKEQQICKGIAYPAEYCITMKASNNVC